MNVKQKVPLIVCLIVLSFILLFSAVVPAGASFADYLNTPYPTFTQVAYNTSAPISTISLGCSPGTPIGWGTVTPDPEWLLLCASCVPVDTVTPTSQPFPTSTLYLTPDGTTTATPGATLTPTVSPTPQAVPLYCDPNSRGGECVQVDPYTVGGFFEWIDPLTPYNYVGAQAALLTMGVAQGTTIYVTFNYAYWAIQSHYGVDRLTTGYLTGNSGAHFETIFTNEIVPANNLWFHIMADPHYYNFVSGVQHQNGMLFYNENTRTGINGDYDGSGEFEVYVSTNGYYTPVYLTPTPVVGDYCSVVSSEPPPSPFGYGDGEVVHNECAVFPGVSFDSTLWDIIFIATPIVSDLIEAFTWEIQPFTFCVQNYNYTLIMFGLEITAWKTLLGLLIFVSALRMWLSVGGTAVGLSKPDDD